MCTCMCRCMFKYSVPIYEYRVREASAMCCRVAGLGLLRGYLFPRCWIGHEDQNTVGHPSRQIEVHCDSCRKRPRNLTGFKVDLPVKYQKVRGTAGRTGFPTDGPHVRKDAKPHLGCGKSCFKTYFILMFTQEPQFYGDFVESLKPPYFFFRESHVAKVRNQNSRARVPIPSSSSTPPTFPSSCALDDGSASDGSGMDGSRIADRNSDQGRRHWCPTCTSCRSCSTGEMVSLKGKMFRTYGRCRIYTLRLGNHKQSWSHMIRYLSTILSVCEAVLIGTFFSKTMGWNRWNGVPYFLTKPRVSFSAECIWKIKGKKLEVLRNTGLLLRLCLLAPYTLVGGLEHLDYFSHHIGNFIIPTDELIFFRGVGQPPTRYSWFIIVLPA